MRELDCITREPVPHLDHFVSCQSMCITLVPVLMYSILDDRGSVHHGAIHRKKSKKMQQCIKILLFHIYMKPNMGDTPPIIRSLKLHWQPLVFHTCKVVGRVVGGRCQANVQQLHVHQPSTYKKTRGCQCSFRPLMMGGVSPKTCWASYKYGIIKF